MQRLDPPVFDMGDVRAGGRHRKRCPIWRAKRCCASFLIGMQISARSLAYYASRTLLPAKTRVFVDFVLEAFRRDRLAERFAGNLG